MAGVGDWKCESCGTLFALTADYRFHRQHGVCRNLIGVANPYPYPHPDAPPAPAGPIAAQAAAAQAAAAQAAADQAANANT